MVEGFDLEVTAVVVGAVAGVLVGVDFVVLTDTAGSTGVVLGVVTAVVLGVVGLLGAGVVTVVVLDVVTGFVGLEVGVLALFGGGTLGAVVFDGTAVVTGVSIFGAVFSGSLVGVAGGFVGFGVSVFVVVSTLVLGGLVTTSSSGVVLIAGGE